MSNKKIWLVVILLATVALSGCTKKMAEKATERAIEKNTGDQVDLNFDNNQVTVETEQGSYQAGENVTLPADWPEDIYVLEGKLVAAMKVATNNGYSMSVVTEQSVSEIKQDYVDKLTDAGWTINMQMDYGESAALSATKDNRTVSVSVTASSDGTNVTIVTGTN